VLKLSVVPEAILTCLMISDMSDPPEYHYRVLGLGPTVFLTVVIVVCVVHSIATNCISCRRWSLRILLLCAEKGWKQFNGVYKITTIRSSSVDTVSNKQS